MLLLSNCKTVKAGQLDKLQMSAPLKSALYFRCVLFETCQGPLKSL